MKSVLSVFSVAKNYQGRTGSAKKKDFATENTEGTDGM